MLICQILYADNINFLRIDPILDAGTYSYEPANHKHCKQTFS
jgi:hypothetical protein